MPDGSDYYTDLGISRDATPDEIRRAYHQAARRLHPDVNVDPGASELFLKVQLAYEVLADPGKRSAYNASLPPLEKTPPPANISTLYSREALPRISEPQMVYVLLEIAPPPEVEMRSTPPLNVCLVLDRSTSMQGQRMDTVKSTAIEIIRQLRTQDILSIVTFSDRAEVLQPAERRIDRKALETKLQMIRPGGATEMYRGMEAGFFEVRRNLGKNSINHLILLTDGRTYGDEAPCLKIAEQAASVGVGISGLGIGTEWNDAFLDSLAGCTGGSSLYVSQPEDIRKLLKKIFLGLNQSYANQVTLDFEIPPGVEFRYAFRLSPEADPLQITSPIRLGGLPGESRLSVLLEFKIPPIPTRSNQFKLMEGQISLEIPGQTKSSPTMNLKLALPISNAEKTAPPPQSLVRAISRLTLYRMQERAHQELAEGKVENASRHLQNLATYLFSQGEQDLARTALQEAEYVQKSHTFSEEGHKRIKYGTRALMLPAGSSRLENSWMGKERGR